MLNANHTETSFPGSLPFPREVRCLLLDDSNFDRARIRRLSKQTKMSIHLDEVDSIAQLDKAVQDENYDLIMIDYRLPVGDGMVALEHVMQSEHNKNAGKIMITGDGARLTAVQAMRAGCHDFLTKEEMDANALRDAMMTALTAVQRQQYQIEQEARHEEIIRKGLIAAMQDSEVQGNVISIMRSQLGSKPDAIRGGLDPKDVDALLAGLDDSDGFIFH